MTVARVRCCAVPHTKDLDFDEIPRILAGVASVNSSHSTLQHCKDGLTTPHTEREILN